MEIEAVESQRLAAGHLIEKSSARFGQRLGLGMAEVDEVGVVGQNLCRRIAQLGAGGAEFADLGRSEGRGAPLPLIFGEEGEGCGPYFACVAGGVLDAARGAYVCSEKFHTCRVYDFIRTNVTIL